MLSPVTDANVDQLVKAVREALGDDLATWPGGWSNEVDTCIVDAVFSTRQLPDDRATAGPAVPRLARAAGRSHRQLARTDRYRRTHQRHQPPARTRAKPSPAPQGRRCETGSGQPCGSELNTAAELVGADPRYVRAVIQRTVGVGPAQSSYLLMLLGIDGVKADTLVTAFVRDHVPEANPPPSSPSSPLPPNE